ncbi:hypothetical protein B0T21DRAFT_362158 [Apiosordaria backusii]|uniref:Uncharacterized protein n=1 Tax=Apiosordaria backusii TaxID=314023 RepID=A0AA40BRX4_9PEZI|nr:hypothetical protein B0T21DRAFT_362158 [Apiosordaria backusii]
MPLANLSKSRSSLISQVQTCRNLTEIANPLYHPSLSLTNPLDISTSSLHLLPPTDFLQNPQYPPRLITPHSTRPQNRQKKHHRPVSLNLIPRLHPCHKKRHLHPLLLMAVLPNQRSQLQNPISWSDC